MPSEDSAPRQTLDFRELTIWRTRLPDVQLAELPPGNDRPNPLVAGDKVFASIFSPGSICALDRESGMLLWRRELGKFAGAAVDLRERKLFAKTSNTLFALHPDSGKILWSFCPYENVRESIYSSPTVVDGSVYIGDRLGYLHRLDADTGHTIWKRQTSSARNNDVNSTPILVAGLAVVSTNAKLAVAYEFSSGKLAWKIRLDGPSTFGPLLHNDSVLIVSKSLYVVNVKTGAVRRQYSWPDGRIHEVVSTPRSIVVTFWPEFVGDRLPTQKAAAGKKAAASAESQRFVFISSSGRLRTDDLALFCTATRYASNTRLLYVSHLHGIEVLNPTTGSLLFKLRTKQDSRGGIAPVDVKGNKVYVLTGDGTVHALRHPKG